MGIEPGRYIVGHELNSKNPVTGQPEFFLKKIVSQIRKALPGDSEKYLGTIVGLATGNPFLGALAGGVGSGVQGALTGGLTGFQSPGIEGLGGGFGRDFVSGQLGSKVDAVGLGELFSKPGATNPSFATPLRKKSRPGLLNPPSPPAIAPCVPLPIAPANIPNGALPVANPTTGPKNCSRSPGIAFLICDTIFLRKNSGCPVTGFLELSSLPTMYLPGSIPISIML